MGATRLLGWGPPASPTAAASDGGSASAAMPFLVEDAGLRLMMPVIDSDGGGKEPRILIDPASINLLPDASLHLDPALLEEAGAP